MATLRDVIDRLKAEGQLTRNTGTNSIKSVSRRLDNLVPVFESIDDAVQEQRDILKRSIEDQRREERRGSAGRSSVNSRESTTIRGGVSRGLESGLGTGIGSILGGLGAGIGLITKIGAVAVGLPAIGLGIAGFFTGLATADAAIGQLGGGENLKTLITNVGEGISSLDGKATTALAALIGVSALWSTVAGIKSMTKAPLGMTAIGLGIGGFMTGLSASGDITGFDGSNFAKQAKNIAEGLSAFSNDQLKGLGALLATGGLFAAIPGGAGLVAEGKAALGITIIGAGLGGFITSLAGITDLGAAIGADGSGFKAISTNIAEGLKSFNGIDGSNLASIGEGIAGLGTGMLALFAQDSLGGIKEGALTAFDRVWSWFTGDETQERKSQFERIADDLQAFNGKSFEGIIALNNANVGASLSNLGLALKDFPEITNLPTTNLANFFTGPIETLMELKDEYGDFSALEEFSSALWMLYSSLKNFQSLEPVDFESVLQISGTVGAFGTLTDLISTLKTGGTIEVPDTSYGGDRRADRTGRVQTKTVRVGGIDSLLRDSETVTDSLRKIRDLFGVGLMSSETAAQIRSQAENYEAITSLSERMLEVSENIVKSMELLESTVKPQGSAVVINAPNNSMTNINQNGGNSTTTAISAGGGFSELDSLGRAVF